MSAAERHQEYGTLRGTTWPYLIIVNGGYWTVILSFYQPIKSKTAALLFTEVNHEFQHGALVALMVKAKHLNVIRKTAIYSDAKYSTFTILN